MENTQTLRGISTISFYATDLKAAKKWYSELLGIVPYIERPGYAEFRIGDYQQELGIIDSKYAPANCTNSPAGAVIYWHVDDIKESLKKLVSMGAEEYQPLINRGNGFFTASVIDPFGNILGIMQNPHYLEVLSSINKIA